ncbi:MAG: AAA family ATPase [Gammaproteobacteria bacterium]|nr:MAG: AAA family ATPase [Gammaproteobacteria bacterium]RLA14622.1 MAG: AAA family ATPase [Gammaproteobacteria bacterium]
MDENLTSLLDRLNSLLTRAEQLLPEPIPPTEWQNALAFRWHRRGERGWLQPLEQIDSIRLADLIGIDRQKKAVSRNVRQFMAGLPANNILLWGSRGTGKSSLLKALLNEFGDDGLRLIEIDRNDLLQLPEILRMVSERSEKFLLFCDDLSFESGDAGYKALKVVLDGSLTVSLDNLLVCATSNRRHLMPEPQSDNLATRHEDGEIHFGEGVEERISLSDRFGLWLAFHPFDQQEYLQIVQHWLDHYGLGDQLPEARELALRWALTRGSRSGRTAWQFARDWAGGQALSDQTG